MIAIDLVSERLARAKARGSRRSTCARSARVSVEVIQDLTDGRGAEWVMNDAVGMEAHGSPVAKLAQTATGLLPDAIGKRLMQTAGGARLQRAVLRHRHPRRFRAVARSR